MKKAAFLTQKGPKAVGPYSTAFCVDNLARQVLENLSTVLAEMGLTLGDVVKTTVFMTDLAAFGRVNAIYAESFREPFPARSCVQVGALPMGAQIEIEAIAVRPE